MRHKLRCNIPISTTCYRFLLCLVVACCFFSFGTQGQILDLPYDPENGPDDETSLINEFLNADSTWSGWSAANVTTAVRLATSYDNDELVVEGFLKNGELSGPVRWYLNGQIAARVTVEGNLLHGTARFYHDIKQSGDTGMVALQGYFITNELEGEAVWYHPNGKLWYKALFIDGHPDGLTLLKYDNGTDHVIGHYLDQKPVGVWKYFAPNSRLCLEEQYDSTGRLKDIVTCKSDAGASLNISSFSKGNGTLFRYTFKGQLKLEQQFKDGLADGKTTYYDSLKNRIEEQFYQAGLKHGVQFIYWPAAKGGRPHERFSWHQGVLQGHYMAWHETGKPAVEGFFYNGKRDSLWLSWHPEGKLASKGYFSLGVPDGKHFTWYQNGQLRSVEKYDEGKADSVWTKWYSNGKLMQVEEYDAGEPIGTWYKYSTEGQITEQQDYIGGLKDGFYKSYYLDGKPEKELCYTQGYRSGLAKNWYDNGQLASSGQYANNEYEDVWTYYHRNGTVKTTERYSQGRLFNTTPFADPKGKILSTYTVVGGHGRRQLYFDNGQLSADLNYKDGLLHGVCLYYSVQGKLLKRIVYQNGKEVSN